MNETVLFHAQVPHVQASLRFGMKSRVLVIVQIFQLFRQDSNRALRRDETLRT